MTARARHRWLPWIVGVPVTLAISYALASAGEPSAVWWWNLFGICP